MDTASLGTRELDVMTVMWARGSGTVTEVQEALDARLAYTTVLTILRNLEGKGLLRREEEGRGHRYFPKTRQHAVQKQALRRLIDTLFGGSAEALITQLVDDRDMTPERLKRLARQLGDSSEGGEP